MPYAITSLASGAPARTAAIGGALDVAEKQRGGARKAALTALATAVTLDAENAKDAGKVRMMATAIRELAAVR